MTEYINCSIHIESVRKKPKSPYTLIIKGHIHSGFNSAITISFDGVDFGGDVDYIPSPVRDLFKEDLNALLGHGPYNDRSKNAKIKKLGIFTYLRSGKVVAKRHENHITRLKELV